MFNILSTSKDARDHLWCQGQGLLVQTNNSLPHVWCKRTLRPSPAYRPQSWGHGPPPLIATSGIRSRPNQITGLGPKSGPAGKSESRGPENGVSRWRRPKSDIYSQNHHFGLVYDMIYQFFGMDANNYKFDMFCQQCHPSVASGDADNGPRNASRIHTRHLFTS